MPTCGSLPDENRNSCPSTARSETNVGAHPHHHSSAQHFCFSLHFSAWQSANQRKQAAPSHRSQPEPVTPTPDSERKQGSSCSPVDGRRSPVQRQDGRVVNDGAVLRVFDDIHGDELGAEGHHVEFGSHRLVRVHHLRDGLSLQPPAGELKHGRAVLLRCHGCKAGRRGLKDQGWRSPQLPLAFQDIYQHHTGVSAGTDNRNPSTGMTQMHKQSTPDVCAIYVFK